MRRLIILATLLLPACWEDELGRPEGRTCEKHYAGRGPDGGPKFYILQCRGPR